MSFVLLSGGISCSDVGSFFSKLALRYLLGTSAGPLLVISTCSLWNTWRTIIPLCEAPTPLRLLAQFTFLNHSINLVRRDRVFFIPVSGINMSHSNPVNCSMFVISLHFKGITIHIRKLGLDCPSAKLYDEQNALLHVAYITKLSVFPIPHLLDGSSHILIGHCLDRVIRSEIVI